MNTPSLRLPAPLKPKSQYLAEAADFDVGIRDLALTVNHSTANDADFARFTQRVEAAATKLDHHYSWMVVHCLADANLNAWVKRSFRDNAAVQGFIADVKRNPKVIDNIPAVASLRRSLSTLSAQKQGIALQLVAKVRQVAGLEVVSKRSTARAEDLACQKTWSIVAAIIMIVVATVVAVVTAGVPDLAATFRGTGPERSSADLRMATVDYNTCAASARRLPPAQRQKAIAACLARMLEAKAGWIG